MCKKFISLFLVFILSITTIFPVHASEVTSSDIFRISELSVKDREFLDKYVSVIDGFISDSGGNIIFTYSDLQLKDIYNFSYNDIMRIHEIISIIKEIL